MTIENQERRIVYDTDGTSLSYSAPFPFLEPEWLEVSVGTGEIGTADTDLVYGVDYDVTGAGQPTGGMVVLAAPPAVGMKLSISRWVPLTQEEVYPEGGKFPAKTTEDCFDKLTMITQQLQDLAGRSDFLPGTSTGDASDVTAWIREHVSAAENAAGAAAVSEENAATSAAAAAVSEARAEEAIIDAENAISVAEAAAETAIAASEGILEHENRAYQWAQNPEDVPVRENPDSSENEYSAYHWAKKAEVGNVPTATEVDEGVVRFGTAAEHAAGLNGVAAQPGRVREMLFANSGADAKLRGDILPAASDAALGAVQPDGETITVDAAGVISAVSSGGGGELPGKIDFLPFRPADLAACAPGWYFANGDRYGLSTPQGMALNALPANYKADWGITADATTINVPNMFYSDGRGYFVRAVNGVARRVGNAEQDQMRPITGEFNYILCGGPGASGAIESTARTNVSVTGSSGYQRSPLNINSALLGTNFNGTDTHPLNIGMTPAVYLGV